MEEQTPGLAEKEETRVRRPRRYRVLLHNDDYTTMEFVVEVLRQVFDKQLPEATRLMLQVHHEGLAVAGIYPREVAETKVSEVTALARRHEMPLLVTAEPE